MSHQTRAQYIVTGGQQEFDLAVPYLDRTHIRVTLNGSIPFFEWVSDSRIRLRQPPVENSVLQIRRETPISTTLVDFQNGANLTAEELNRAHLQNLYRLQEIDDLYTDALDRAQVRLGDHLGVVTTPDAIMDELLRISEMGDDLLNRFRDALASIDLSAERILDQSFQLTDQAFRTDTLDGVIANTAARTASLETSFDSLAGLVDALANLDDGTGLATIIDNEAQQRVQGDTALATTLALIGAKNGQNNAFVLNLNTVRVSSTESLAQRLDAITSKANGNEARIIAEETTRANAISAEAARIDGLLTRVGSAEANILAEQTARSTADTAFTNSLNAWIARVQSAEASITTEATARTTADTSFAQTLALLGARNTNGSAFVLDQNTVQVAPGETMSSRFSTMTAATNNAITLVTTETTNRINADGALSTRIDTLGSRTDSNEAAIANEVTARTNAISAEASERQALTSRVAGNETAILNEQATRANAIAAESQARQSLASQVAANSTAIQNEATTRANADGAIAQQFAVLGAWRNGQSAFVLDLNRVEVAAGWTLGTRLSGIDTSIGNVSASVVDERTARINGDNALSQTLQTVQNTVGGNTASITSLQEVTNGLNTRYGVALNGNGHITGFVMNNNSSYGTFAIVADNFSITAPNGGSPVQPFSVVAGRARFNANVDIYGDLMVTGSINNTKLVDNTVSGVKAAYAAGTISLNNATPTRIHGEWITVEKASSPIDITFNAWATFLHNAGGSFVATVQLVRSRGETGGDVIQSFNINGSGMANDVWQGAIPVLHLDRPNEAGNWHYYVQIFFNVSNMTTQSVTARYAKLVELKNNTSTLGGGTGSGGGVGSGGGSSGGGGGGGGGGIDPYDPGGGGYTDQPVIT